MRSAGRGRRRKYGRSWLSSIRSQQFIAAGEGAAAGLKRSAIDPSSTSGSTPEKLYRYDHTGPSG